MSFILVVRLRERSYERTFQTEEEALAELDRLVLQDDEDAEVFPTPPELGELGP